MVSSQPLVVCPDCKNPHVTFYQAGTFWCHGCDDWYKDESTDEYNARVAAADKARRKKEKEDGNL